MKRRQFIKEAAIGAVAIPFVPVVMATPVQDETWKMVSNGDLYDLDAPKAFEDVDGTLQWYDGYKNYEIPDIDRATNPWWTNLNG